jgi:hypothetical protein
VKKVLAVFGLMAVGSGAIWLLSKALKLDLSFASAPKKDPVAPAETPMLPKRDPIEATIGRPRPSIFDTKEQRDQALQSIIAAESANQMRQPQNSPVLIPNKNPVLDVPAPAPLVPTKNITLEPAPLVPNKNILVETPAPPVKDTRPVVVPQPTITKDFSAEPVKGIPQRTPSAVTIQPVKNFETVREPALRPNKDVLFPQPTLRPNKNMVFPDSSPSLTKFRG